MNPQKDATGAAGQARKGIRAHGSIEFTEGQKGYHVMKRTSLGKRDAMTPERAMKANDPNGYDSSAQKKIRVNRSSTSPQRAVSVSRDAERTPSPFLKNRSLIPRNRSPILRNKSPAPGRVTSPHRRPNSPRPSTPSGLSNPVRLGSPKRLGRLGRVRRSVSFERHARSGTNKSPSITPETNRVHHEPRGVARVTHTSTRTGTKHESWETVTEDESDSDTLATKAKDRAHPFSEMTDLVDGSHHTRGARKILKSTQQAVPPSPKRRITNQFKVYGDAYSALESAERSMRGRNGNNKKKGGVVGEKKKKKRERPPSVVSDEFNGDSDSSDTERANSSLARRGDTKSKAAPGHAAPGPGNVLRDRVNGNKENRQTPQIDNTQNKLAETEAKIARLEAKVTSLRSHLQAKKRQVLDHEEKVASLTDVVEGIANIAPKLVGCKAKEEIMALLKQKGLSKVINLIDSD